MIFLKRAMKTQKNVYIAEIHLLATDIIIEKEKQMKILLYRIKFIIHSIKEVFQKKIVSWRKIIITKPVLTEKKYCSILNIAMTLKRKTITISSYQRQITKF